MKIERTIKGKVYEFELTMEEMMQVVAEFAQVSYRQFILAQIEELTDNDTHVALARLDTDERNAAADEMVSDFQYLVEEGGYDEFEAWNQVAHDYIAKHNL